MWRYTYTNPITLTSVAFFKMHNQNIQVSLSLLSLSYMCLIKSQLLITDK